MNSDLVSKCKKLLLAYKSGDLGQTVMPEDNHPRFGNQEDRLSYFTLPMALNYQRSSYKLWGSALETRQDPDTKCVFDVDWSANALESELRDKLLKYKLALQPNKHIRTWQAISRTIFDNWGTISILLDDAGNDFLKLKQVMQVTHKKGFPYLSGPKIFNYWSFIISTYGAVKLKNRNAIDIAPDTHITKCSVELGVITEEESRILSKEEISQRWRDSLSGSGIDPIDMHSPLWFWSRNGFLFKL